MPNHDPVFNPADVEQLRDRANRINGRYWQKYGSDEEVILQGEIEAVWFLSLFQAYCELTGRQNPQ